MKKQTIYIASLEEVLNGRYYDIESLEDYQNAVENFLDICEKRNLSDDLEIQYIDGELTGEATDYIEDVLRLAEENEEDFILCGYEIISSRNSKSNRKQILSPLKDESIIL